MQYDLLKKLREKYTFVPWSNYRSVDKGAFYSVSINVPDIGSVRVKIPSINNRLINYQSLPLDQYDVKAQKWKGDVPVVSTYSGHNARLTLVQSYKELGGNPNICTLIECHFTSKSTTKSYLIEATKNDKVETGKEATKVLDCRSIDFKNGMTQPGFRFRYRNRTEGGSVIPVEYLSKCLSEIYQCAPSVFTNYSGSVSPGLGASGDLDYSSFFVPKQNDFTEEQKIAYLKEATMHGFPTGTFNAVIPSMCEFDFDEREVVFEQIRKHLAQFPAIQLIDIAKKYICYTSDAGSLRWELTPDAVNQPRFNRHFDLEQDEHGIYHYKMKEGCNSSERAIIYIGECWAVYFTVGGEDVLKGNRVFVATPKQFKKAYQGLRDDLIPEDWEPWSDFMFISTNWCERNGNVNYGRGIDLSSPHQRKLSLFGWIIGPLSAKYLQDRGKPMAGINISNGNDRALKLSRLAEVMNKIKAPV